MSDPIEDEADAVRVVEALRAGVVWVDRMRPTCVEAPNGWY